MDNKLNILIDLRKMLNIYSQAKEIDGNNDKRNKIDFIRKNHLEFGFCFLIISFGYKEEYSIEILDELVKESKEKSTLKHWYLIPKQAFTIGGRISVDKDTLQPRIDHLKRTIARLEKELNINN